MKLAPFGYRAAIGLGAGLIAAAGCGNTSGTDRASRASSSAAQGAGAAVDPPGSNQGSAAQPLECVLDGDAASGYHHLTPFVGTITGDDPAQHGWFGAPLTDAAPFGPPTCDTPNPSSSVVSQDADIHYDEYVFENWTDADACISIDSIMTPFAYGGNGSMQTAAFVGPFDPSDIQKNLVGAEANTYVAHFNIKVPASATFEVVVIGKAFTGDPSTFTSPELPALYRPYVLWVANCGLKNASDGGSDAGMPEAGGDDAGDNGGGSGDGATGDGATGDGATGDGGTGKTW